MSNQIIYFDCVTVDIQSVYVPRDERSERWRKYHTDACAMCGKPVGKNPLYILAVNGGLSMIANRLDDSTLEKADGGYMGCHAVGSTCAKRIKTIVKKQGLDPDLYVFNLEPLGQM